MKHRRNPVAKFSRKFNKACVIANKKRAMKAGHLKYKDYEEEESTSK